jgi:conjugal transfer pilus assembly protein TraW
MFTKAEFKRFVMIFATILAISAAELDLHNQQANGHKCIDLGTYGETFPITEKNFLDVIKAKLQKMFESGKLADHQKVIAKQAKEQLNRPNPVKGISKTTKPRSFIHDPSITVPYDLKDHKGRVFHVKGTKVNPLDTHEFKYPFLFVDGDDAEQVAWAIHQYQAANAAHKPKIILIQGTPIELSKKLNLPIYFDQSGVLVKKFGLTQIPARVSQKAKVFLIEEIDLLSQRESE